jgi:hypothetical protein
MEIYSCARFKKVLDPAILFPKKSSERRENGSKTK